MSGLSPSRRLRTKTSDLTDFFRGAGHSSSHARQQDAASVNLEVPSGDEAGQTTKKKITRIPLFGRSRKKSNQSTASSPFTTSSLARDSADIGEQSSRAASTDRRPSEPSAIHVQPPPLPVPSKASTSLSSKLAAHFSHARSSRILGIPQTESAPTQPAASSLGLVPPSNRSASSESGSSGGTKTRSTTPRPARPTIMVSLSNDNNEEFKDLFTRPTDSPGSSRLVLQPPPEDPQKPSSAPSPIIRTPEPSIYKRGHTPASAIAAAVRDRQNFPNERPASTSSKNSSSRKNSDSDKGHERHDGSSTPRLYEARESPRLSSPEKEKGLPPSLQRRSSVATGYAQSSENVPSSPRSRMKLPSAHTRSRPPSMPPSLPPPSPLPPPPPSSPLPVAPSNLPTASDSQAPPTESGTSQKVHVRPRAHTISSIVNAPVPLSPLSRSLTTDHTSPIRDNFRPTTIGETLDINTASAEVLRSALRARNEQYDELATLVLKMTESHVAEVTALEKKIATLEKEARKRETQIKGFTWLLNDGESPQQPKALPPGVMNQSRFATSLHSGAESDRGAYRNQSGRLAYQSDSGAESNVTSGAESLRASGASGTESMSSIFRNKKLRRPYPVGETSNLSRTGSMLRSPKIPPAANSDKTLPDPPYLSSGKRSSMSSTSPSPSSSTSSLLPPSPSITMSSLSAIPEGSGPTSTLRLPREASEQQEDRRAIRASHRTSTSSMTSSSTAASSSYSTNIKRSRPTSIAQVLEKSPNLEDVLEKLRPFS
ncbi:hypothetical protein GALMADRAFT_225426 [Galerina marginata CBS 339.88]|uniref:Uncharacterized protein n=1 Tax=Galerina marginata (strain CBS 339.88) TaxID=685588 RepID=A0A067T295_GALM3|nr:hypothetical protein GALMADRAFT_225426 [Galerina marginata CBS 339.88]